MRGPVGGHKGVLNGVSGFLAVSERPEGDGPEPIPVPPHELTEGVGVAVYVKGQEVLIAGVAVRGVICHRTPSLSALTGDLDVRHPAAVSAFFRQGQLGQPDQKVAGLHGLVRLERDSGTGALRDLRVGVEARGPGTRVAGGGPQFHRSVAHERDGDLPDVLDLAEVEDYPEAR